MGFSRFLQIPSLRCGLRTFAGACALVELVALATAAENWMFSTPALLPETINLRGTTSMTPWLSDDGLTLYFASDRPGGLGLLDIWVADRERTQDNWNSPVNLGAPVNTSGPESMPSLSADGLTLYFGDANALGWPARAGGPGNFQIWTAKRTTKDSGWSIPTDLKAPIGTSGSEQYPHILADGLAIYFTRRPDIMVARRESQTDSWLAPVKLPAPVTQGYSGFPYLSSSGMHLFFYSDRNGGRGSFDLWMASRSSVTNEWGSLVNLGPQVNTANLEMSPCISKEFPAIGSYLLFSRGSTAGFDGRFQLYQSTVMPSVSLERSAKPDGPWTRVSTANYFPISSNTYRSEITWSTNSDAAFYRLALNAITSAAQFTLAEKVGTKLVLEYRIE